MKRIMILCFIIVLSTFVFIREMVSLAVDPSLFQLLECGAVFLSMYLAVHLLDLHDVANDDQT